MGAWILNLPIIWMSIAILGGIYLFAAAVYVLITALAVGERARAFKMISPGMLALLGIIFALLVAFLASQVWSQSDRANVAVDREASALRGVVLLAAGFPGEPERRLQELVRRHIQNVVTQEWPAMARGTETLTIVPAPLDEALRFTLALTPRGEGQAVAQREIVTALLSALEARRQRIILSESSINGVKWTVLLVQAGLTFIAIALIHSENRAANRIILAIFATAVGMAFVLLAAHSRPFTGGRSVQPTVLLQIMPEVGPHTLVP
jgi:hypothetical protein